MGHVLVGILRAATRIASTCNCLVAASLLLWLAMPLASHPHRVFGQDLVRFDLSEPTSQFSWDFGRSDDPHFRGVPEGWRRYQGRGYPKYVGIGIEPKEPAIAQHLTRLDANLIELWKVCKRRYPKTPMPPSIADLLVDRYLRIDLDGGQAMYESPAAQAKSIFQYRLTCQIMTQGLRHDTASAELVFLDASDSELAIHSTTVMRGSNDWTTVHGDLVRPPAGATKMVVRLRVDRGEDGLEDIHGSVGFDNVQLRYYPQLQIATDEALGIYTLEQTVHARAKVMGLPVAKSKIEFRLVDFLGQEIASEVVTVSERANVSGDTNNEQGKLVDASVDWALPNLKPGFYRLAATVVGRSSSTLEADTTFAVVDEALGGAPRGAFGWTLSGGSDGTSPRDFVNWLSALGVAWIKYPCWLSSRDTEGAEQTAVLLEKLQEAGIQTVGLLDQPPEDEIELYTQRGRRELVAANLLSDRESWQPLLEPTMTRLGLKVRTWQLGSDRDHSFLDRPGRMASVRDIASGLQGFGQPIDLAISWPWLEREPSPQESSWQAICRSSSPSLSAKELDAFLSMRPREPLAKAPKTWLLVDPISKSRYSLEDRIRDLVLRMATVRNHSVQAAFVSRPRDPEHGLLEKDSRPGELLLPWRTTARLIGSLRPQGAIHLRSGAQNLAFVGADRAVLMLWSAVPTEERIYLGDNVKSVDVWGRATSLTNEVDGNQIVQRIPIGPIPIFVIGVDRELLAFRMSVALNESGLDSFLGLRQQLNIRFTNPTQESLVGRFAVRAPDNWQIDSPVQDWEMLGGRSSTHEIDVVLGNTSRIGDHDLPIQFLLDTVPPKVITVHKKVSVGPEGLDLDVTTRLTPEGELRVQIEMTNHTDVEQAYDCLLFPSAQRQHQRRYVTVAPGQTMRRYVYWESGRELVGRRMLLRADEVNGPRVFNHSFVVTR